MSLDVEIAKHEPDCLFLAWKQQGDDVQCNPVIAKSQVLGRYDL